MNAITQTAADVAHVEGAIRNPGNPHHFMVIKPQDRRVRIYLGDQLLADSTGAVQVVEIGKTAYEPAFYLPAGDLSVDFQRSAKSTHCPLKGDAGYVELAGEELGWVYPEPFAWADQLSGRIAFWSSRVRIVLGD
jgi:uncharacterized protein (DUF427 family)